MLSVSVFTKNRIVYQSVSPGYRMCMKEILKLELAADMVHFVMSELEQRH